jgi:hypothetical protein
MEVRANQSITLTIPLHLYRIMKRRKCHCISGDAQPGCGLSDISVRINKHTELYNGVPAYTATFLTSCSCPMKDVHVTCVGLDQSVKQPDPSLVDVLDEGVCVLKQPIVPGKPYEFDYALAAPMNFRPISGYAAC